MLCSVIKHSGWGYSTQPEGEKHSTTLHVSSLHFIRVDKSKGRDSKGCFANFVQRRLKTSLKKLKAPFFFKTSTLRCFLSLFIITPQNISLYIPISSMLQVLIMKDKQVSQFTDIILRLKLTTCIWQ